MKEIVCEEESLRAGPRALWGAGTLAHFRSPYAAIQARHRERVIKVEGECALNPEAPGARAVNARTESTPPTLFPPREHREGRACIDPRHATPGAPPPHTTCAISVEGRTACRLAPKFVGWECERTPMETRENRRNRPRSWRTIHACRQIAEPKANTAGVRSTSAVAVDLHNLESRKPLTTTTTVKLRSRTLASCIVAIFF